jgi:hypothetical protein
MVYTSFAAVGFRTIASSEVPREIQQIFVNQIVYQYWDVYHPPGFGYRAAYVYQIVPDQVLFGWLYNDGADDLGCSHVPYFVCYYQTGYLCPAQLATLFTWLQNGLVSRCDRQRFPAAIAPIYLSSETPFPSALAGVEIPANLQEQCMLDLCQGTFLHLFIEVVPETDGEAFDSLPLFEKLSPSQMFAYSGGTNLSTPLASEEYSQILLNRAQQDAPPSLPSPSFAFCLSPFPFRLSPTQLACSLTIIASTLFLGAWLSGQFFPFLDGSQKAEGGRQESEDRRQESEEIQNPLRPSPFARPLLSYPPYPPLLPHPPPLSKPSLNTRIRFGRWR